MEGIYMNKYLLSTEKSDIIAVCKYSFYVNRSKGKSEANDMEICLGQHWNKVIASHIPNNSKRKSSS